MSCFNWSGLRGSNSLPGIPRMACGHSQEPYLTSDLNVLRTSGGGSEFSPLGKKQDIQIGCPVSIGAGYEARTRYLHLGKVALYQMS